MPKTSDESPMPNKNDLVKEERSEKKRKETG
jgi:hypothetical protein